jgi:hypothetical protein
MTINGSSSKSLKNISKKCSVTNRVWIKKKTRESDNDVFTRMKEVSLKIQELKDELTDVGFILDREIQTEKRFISEQDTINMKEFIILNGIFSQYISEIGRAKVTP